MTTILNQHFVFSFLIFQLELVTRMWKKKILTIHLVTRNETFYLSTFS